MEGLTAQKPKGSLLTNPIRLGMAALVVVLVIAGLLVAMPKRSHPIVSVSQRDRHFIPDKITIERGTIVHILNNDNVTHHIYVKQPDMNFSSDEQPVGRSVDVEFDQKGTFNVRCAIHPTMHLKVIVR